jgi:putative SOS response-associated peptidase YedK
MCYSAQIEADYKKFTRATGAEDVSLKEFFERYWRRQPRLPFKTPKAMDRWFTGGPLANPEIAQHIADFNAGEIAKLEQDVFKQKKRLADAERTLQTRTTKKALEDQRIATDKIAWALGKLADLKRPELVPRDARIFPGWYAPVVISEGGRRVVVPMRYQCRLPGWNEAIERKYPGTYNARRDKLEVSWGKLFGHQHGILVVNRFYENVERLDTDGKPHNVVLEFKPQIEQPMVVACLWSRCPTPDGDLLSFAAITDEPPAEVAAAGHDRCIVPIKPEHIEAWLNPDPNNLAACYAILDDRERPYYEHRLAA